jgi:hypothetical protein
VSTALQKDTQAASPPFKVVLHGKALPWFVSDVTKYDLDWLLEQLEGSEGA